MPWQWHSDVPSAWVSLPGVPHCGAANEGGQRGRFGSARWAAVSIFAEGAASKGRAPPLGPFPGMPSGGAPLAHGAKLGVGTGDCNSRVNLKDSLEEVLQQKQAACTVLMFLVRQLANYLG